MNTERLLKLADHLDTIPPEKFDLETWWCGSVGCAIGHATMIFKEDGFILREPVDVDGFVNTGFYPCYLGRTGWDAVEGFFDLYDYDEEINADSIAEYLFAEHAYDDGFKSSKDVASRIRWCVSQAATT